MSDAAAGTQDLRFRVSGLCHLGLLYDLLEGILGGGGGYVGLCRGEL